jgi:hypothetical protein
MKTKFFLGILAIAVIPLISSCDEDEPKPATIGFDLVEDEVTESNGNTTSFSPLDFDEGVGAVYELKLVLDKALPSQAVVKYSLGGSAKTISGDFSVEGQTFVIEKGAKEAIIPITIFEDWEFEILQTGTNAYSIYEDITVTLDEVVSGPIKINEEANSFTLKILEDDFLIFLDWDPQDDALETRGDVDMDLIIWYNDQAIGGSDAKNTNYEAIYIPGGYYNGTYSFSYPYYNGSSNDLDFYVIMYGFINGQFYDAATGEDAVVSSATYTLQNKNTYSLTGVPNVAKVQTVVKEGYDFMNLSSVQVPASGSRMIAPTYTMSPERMSQLRQVIKTAKRLPAE